MSNLDSRIFPRASDSHRVHPALGDRADTHGSPSRRPRDVDGDRFRSSGPAKDGHQRRAARVRFALETITRVGGRRALPSRHFPPVGDVRVHRHRQSGNRSVRVKYSATGTHWEKRSHAARDCCSLPVCVGSRAHVYARVRPKPHCTRTTSVVEHKY